MENFVKVKQILVVRNDSTTNWELSNYVLQSGEVGIGWLKDSGKPITKVGDGIHTWMQLPQSEYVFLEDLQLSYDFGRHKTVNGIVNAGGNGMTVSEWIKDALTEILAPKITQPNYTVTVQDVTTDTMTNEIGSKINTITWSTLFTPGWYEFGSYGNKDKFLPEVSVIYHADFNGDVLFDESSEGVPGGEIYPNIQITTTENTKYGHIETSVTWSDAANDPANNRGEKVDGIIRTGNKAVGADIFMTGYREGCFFGGTDKDITVDNVRNLNTTGDNYKAGELQFVVAPGMDKLLIAYDARYTGPTSIYNNSVNAEMIDNFVTEEIEIPGANAFEPITYKIMIYEPAEAYVNPAKITITLG